MALNADKLIKKLDDKSKLYFDSEYAQFSEIFKEKLYRVIAESVIEHFKENAEIKVIVVGADGGSSIAANYIERFITRGDLRVPGGTERGGVVYEPLSSTSGLQTSTQAASSTTAPASTKILSTPGFID